MSKVNTMEQDNIYVRYSIIIVGITIMSIGVNGFLRQAHLLSGGVAGIATAINYITNINVGFLTFIINVPIFLLGFIFLEKDFLITSLINMVLFSIIIGVTQDIGNIIPIDDILLQSIYGGILCGVGNGLVFRTKSSFGGTDIIGAILKNELNNEDIISMCFTMTKDLDAVYPAVAVREILDIHDIPMLNYEEKHIQGSLSKCIRVMMYINTEKTKADIKHIYLNNAKNLRKDLINN